MGKASSPGALKIKLRPNNLYKAEDRGIEVHAAIYVRCHSANMVQPADGQRRRLQSASWGVLLLKHATTIRLSFLSKMC